MYPINNLHFRKFYVTIITMAITEKDIKKENGKEYLDIRYSKSNLTLIRDLTEKLGHDGDFEKTLMLALAALKKLAKGEVVQLKE